MPRLFTGLELPSDLAAELATMRGGIYGARWIDVENYHLTLRFIGDIDEATACDIDIELGRIKRQPFTVTLEGLSCFGGDKPRAIVARAPARLRPRGPPGRQRAPYPPRWPAGRAAQVHAACHARAAARRLADGGGRLPRRTRLPHPPVHRRPVRPVLLARLDRRGPLSCRGDLPAGVSEGRDRTPAPSHTTLHVNLSWPRALNPRRRRSDRRRGGA